VVDYKQENNNKIIHQALKDNQQIIHNKMSKKWIINNKKGLWSNNSLKLKNKIVYKENIKILDSIKI
jgi:hypothetical protein